MNDVGKISNSVYKELDKVGGSIIAILHLFSNFFLISIIALIPLLVSWKVTLISFIILLLLFTPTKLLNIIFYKLGKKFTKEFIYFLSYFSMLYLCIKQFQQMLLTLKQFSKFILVIKKLTVMRL